MGATTPGERRIVVAVVVVTAALTVVSWFDTPGLGFWAMLGCFLPVLLAVPLLRRRDQGQLDRELTPLSPRRRRFARRLLGALVGGGAIQAVGALAMRLWVGEWPLVWLYVAMGVWWTATAVLWRGSLRRSDAALTEYDAAVARYEATRAGSAMGSD